MKSDKKNMRLEDFILSFKEIWKFDKCLLFILLADIIIDSFLPFPNIMLSGLIVDSIVNGKDFMLVIFYVVLLFGINFFSIAIKTFLGKSREYLIIKFTSKLNNDINNKCMNIDFEQFNESSFQDRIVWINQMAYGNNFFSNITNLQSAISRDYTKTK